MYPVKTDSLPVPGATLHYEIRGSGPVLLLICGGVYDAAAYAGLAQLLADRYTVVTYDRRGNSRSPLDGPPAEQVVAVHADDAYRILTAVGVTADEPAYVFGNSSGATFGLDLVARHPELVRLLVAHEAPIFDLLPDREHWRTVLAEVADAYRTGGPGAAFGVFGAAMGMRGDQPSGEDGDGGDRIPGGQDAPQGQPDPEMLAMMGRMEKNMEFFIAYEVPPVGRWTLDLDALRAAPTRVVAAAGEDSTGEPPHRAALALAERLGTEPVLFPGDHGGFGQQVDTFGPRLQQVLAGS